MAEQTAALHPLLSCAQTIEDAMKAVADVNPVFLSSDQKREALLRLSRLVDQVGELRGRVLACADDVAADDEARDPAAWLAHQTRTRIGPRRSSALAKGLDRWALVGAGVREATVSTEQAAVIIAALDALPADLDPDLRAQCESRLVAEAAHHDPHALRILGRRLLDILDPDASESREAEALDKEERDAARRTFLRWRRNGDGTVDFRGRVSDAVLSDC